MEQYNATHTTRSEMNQMQYYTRMGQTLEKMGIYNMPNLYKVDRAYNGAIIIPEH
jgi:hypothetical protein